MRIFNANDGPGAQNVKGISLVPTSPANYSNIVDGYIVGNIQGAFSVQAASSGTGGAVVKLSVDGNLSGVATIPKVESLTINTVSGTINVVDLAGG